MSVTQTVLVRNMDNSNAEVEEQFLAADLKTMERLEEEDAKGRRKLQIVWLSVFRFSLMHIAAAVGGYLFFSDAMWKTCLWAFFLHIVGAMGITAGAHRYWSHRCFKATLPARIIFMLMTTLAFQNDTIEWARDHRCHHKWTDTDADPHNSRRGFFYSHMGWLMTKKNEKLREMGSKVDISDLLADEVLMFQRRNYAILVVIVCFLLPTVVPVFFWGENPWVSYFVAGVFRYVFTLHSTFLINSAAHTFGYKPYDRKITAKESVWTNMQAVGEGGHNFHHTFPQDYRASEFSWMTNWTRALLDIMAFVGLIYDRKVISNEAIERQIAAKGDSLVHIHHH